MENFEKNPQITESPTGETSPKQDAATRRVNSGRTLVMLAALAALSAPACNSTITGSETVTLPNPVLDNMLEGVTIAFLKGEIDETQAETAAGEILSKAGVNPGTIKFNRNYTGQGEFSNNSVSVNPDLAMAAFRNKLITPRIRQYGPRKR
ncbi:MAG: hypothetical protein ABIH78_04680 [Candidatus Peregrinibacteria bacterium]